MLFALIIYGALATTAFALGGVRFAARQWVAPAAIAALGTLPFCVPGLTIGSRANASGAPAPVNLVYLPMAFLSGLWMPPAMLAPVIGALAPAWPAYHLAQLALAAIVRAGTGSITGHLAALGGVAAVCFATARRRLARAA